MTFKIEAYKFFLSLGDCVMVAQQILDLLVRVRILLPQTFSFFLHKHIFDSGPIQRCMNNQNDLNYPAFLMVRRVIS